MEKMIKLGVKREAGLFYYWKDGDVWAFRRFAAPSIKDSSEVPVRGYQKVVGEHVQITNIGNISAFDGEYLYFLDSEGDISRKPYSVRSKTQESQMPNKQSTTTPVPYPTKEELLWKEMEMWADLFDSECAKPGSGVGAFIAAEIRNRMKKAAAQAGVSDLASPVVSFRRVPSDTIELGKRTYLPFVATSTCPQCGEVCEVDLTSDYLSYPVIGAATDLTFVHEVEEGPEYVCHEWTVPVILDVTLRPAP